MARPRRVTWTRRANLLARLEAIEAELVAVRHALVQDSKAHTDEAVAALDRVVMDRTRRHTDAAVNAAERNAIATARAHAESIAEQLAAELADRVAEIRRDLNALARDRAPAPAPASGQASAQVMPVAPVTGAVVGASYYVALEDRFRGSVGDISQRQSTYLDRLRADGRVFTNPVVDLGSGRGEWLELLREAGIPALGVDTNAELVAEARERGLDVVDADLLTFLRDRPDASVAAVTMFQVVEHLPFDVLVAVVEQCARALEPGGMLVLETPNSANLLVAASTFWIDPTHVRPLHPEVLSFVVQRAGFARWEPLYVNRLGPEPLVNTDPLLARLAELVDGPGDFALLAWR